MPDQRAPVSEMLSLTGLVCVATADPTALSCGIQMWLSLKIKRLVCRTKPSRLIGRCCRFCGISSCLRTLLSEPTFAEFLRLATIEAVKAEI